MASIIMPLSIEHLNGYSYVYISFTVFQQCKSNGQSGADAVRIKVKTIKFKESLSDGQRREPRILLKKVVEIIRIVESEAVGNFRNTEVGVSQ